MPVTDKLEFYTIILRVNIGAFEKSHLVFIIPQFLFL